MTLNERAAIARSEHIDRVCYVAFLPQTRPPR
jgi:hypothetical protein